MSALVRWGFDRKAGAKARPVPLVRSCGEMRKLREANRLAAQALAVSAACDRIFAGNAQPEDRKVIDDWTARRAVKPKEAAAATTVVEVPEKKKAGPRIKSGATTEEYQAKAGDEVQGGRRREPCMEPVSRPAAGRSAAATSELMDVTAGETAPVSDPVRQAPVVQASVPVVHPIPLGSTSAPPVRDSEPVHPRVGTREYFPGRVEEVRKAPAPIDWGRVASAAAQKKLGGPAPKPKPTRVAISPEACTRCGIPGRRGCDHQLPYEAPQ